MDLVQLGPASVVSDSQFSPVPEESLAARSVVTHDSGMVERSEPL